MKINFERIHHLMNPSSGWREEWPDEHYWYFTKMSKFRGYRVVVDWNRQEIRIHRLKRIA